MKIENSLIFFIVGMDPDDELDAGYTDSEGKFELAGDEREITNIDPELKIYHDCNKGINVGLKVLVDFAKLQPCPRKWVIGIPDNYITAGQTPKKYFDLGTVNLEVELEKEDHDCIH